MQRRVATGETAKGREAIREALEEMFRVFPDFYIEVRDLFAAKNRICVECTLTGTHEGESQGISPTGRRIEADICLVFRIGRDGLVEEKTIYSDSATMLRQLGLFAESRHRQGVRRMDRAVFERDRLALVSPRHCADRARIGVRCTSLAREHAPNDATE